MGGIIKMNLCIREFCDHVMTQFVQGATQIGQTVVTEIGHDPIQPGAKLRLSTEIRQRRPGAYKRFLCQIERLFFIFEDPQSKVIDIALMFGHQRREGFLVAFLGALDEVLFRIWHEVSTRLDRGKEEKFHPHPTSPKMGRGN
jgi:hypothetical protein